MIADKETFLLIVKNSIYIFLKEQYSHSIDNENDVVELEKRLLKLEKFGHIPDKILIIEKYYKSIKALMIDELFEEKVFLESLTIKTTDFSLKQKEYILNAVIFIANEDKKISDKEKESILQISKALNIELSYKEIMKNYYSSEFNDKGIPRGFIIVSILIIILLIGGIFWKVKSQPKIQTFDTNKYQFDEITFNRYILYKNQFNVENNEAMKYFKKYAVYYISGRAKISFNPKEITYNPVLKTLTVSENFTVDLEILQKDEIDNVSPKEISKKTAQNIGVVVGLAGAYSASNTTSRISDYLPSRLKSSSNIGLGLITGATAYFVTSSVLDGAKFTSDISMTERKETLKIGESLIKAQLSTDSELLNMYRQHFEVFIKAKYKTWNKEVEIVNYSSSSKEVK